MLACLAGCKPASFAHREADLLREPPPLLPGDATSFWNDRASATYGEFVVGPRFYRAGDRLCRAARVTSLNEATNARQDRTLLYCQAAQGGFRLDTTLSCRRAAGGDSIACRGPEGDDVVLPPA